MMRAALVMSLCLVAAPALAQQADAGASAPPGPVTTLDGTTTSPSTATPPSSADFEAMKRDLLEQAKHEADDRVAKAKEEMRNEVRAELATQSANRSWEDEWQEQKKKLELIEVDGYLRVRPTLLYNMDLGVGTNPDGKSLFPRTILDPHVTDVTAARTLAWADMRARMEPTLNISEDIRIRSQIDLLNNLILGSTPQIDPGSLNLLSTNQLTPNNAVIVRRIWGEVNTPVGLLSFGRMGDNWGMGMFHNDGNCLDCDYGNTIDRVMFTARIAGFYLMPMIDYVGKGTTSSSQSGALNTLATLGAPADYTQEDDVYGPFNGPAVSFIAARRDTDKEAQRKLDNGEYVLNYGLYYSYRQQKYEALPNANSGSNLDCTTNPTQPACSIIRSGYVHEPDLWARFMMKRLKLEVEGAAVLGTVSNTATIEGTVTPPSVNILQMGGAARGEYRFLDGALAVSLEYGIASGDSQTQLGTGTGATQNLCTPHGAPTNGPCTVTSSTNFVFNPDYRVDDILWREVLGSVTDAMYVKPGVRYTIVEGLDVFLYAVYSRALFASNTPGNNANLGVEFDPGVSYTSDDGFVASLHYGGLIPLAGLNSPGTGGSTGTYLGNHEGITLDPSAAHALRLNLAIKF